MKNPHLKLGDTHKSVKHLIRALRRSPVGYYFTRPFEGWNYGPGLKYAHYKHMTYYIVCAVRGFQHREGLPRTGECDAATWAKLERFL